jgi:plasmid rolling circle replication initiator protein Rep
MEHNSLTVTGSTLHCESLSEASPKDAKWDDHRLYTDIIRDIYANAGWERYAERADACSTWLQFRRIEGDKLQLGKASFCRLRYCPVCQWRRSLMWRGRFIEALPSIKDEYPTSRWILLTLTVKNPPMSELRATLTAMNTAWKRLIQRKDWPALGFIRSTEITRGEDGNPHPHFHAILQVRSSYFKKAYISKEKWQLLWKECLRADYLPVLDVRVIKEKEEGSDGVAGIMGGACEVLKYTTKVSKLILEEEFIVELTKQTHKLRFLATGGTLKKVLGNIEPESDDDLIHVDGDASTDVPTEAPKVDFLWKQDEKRYKRGKPDKARIRQGKP